MRVSGWRLVGGGEEHPSLIVVSACGCWCGRVSAVASASPVCPLHSSSSSLGQPLPYIPSSYLIPQILGWYHHLFPLSLILGWGRFLRSASSGLFPHLLF